MIMHILEDLWNDTCSSLTRHLHVGMTLIQNGSYFWLKNDLLRVSLLSQISNIPAFFLGHFHNLYCTCTCSFYIYHLTLFDLLIFLLLSSVSISQVTVNGHVHSNDASYRGSFFLSLFLFSLSLQLHADVS